MTQKRLGRFLAVGLLATGLLFTASACSLPGTGSDPAHPSQSEINEALAADPAGYYFDFAIANRLDFVPEFLEGEAPTSSAPYLWYIFMLNPGAASDSAPAQASTDASIPTSDPGAASDSAPAQASTDASIPTSDPGAASDSAPAQASTDASIPTSDPGTATDSAPAQAIAMSKQYVEDTIKAHFEVKKVTHEPLEKEWDFDGEQYRPYPTSYPYEPIFGLKELNTYTKDDVTIYSLLMEEYAFDEFVMESPLTFVPAADGSNVISPGMKYVMQQKGAQIQSGQLKVWEAIRQMISEGDIGQFTAKTPQWFQYYVDEKSGNVVFIEHTPLPPASL